MGSSMVSVTWAPANRCPSPPLLHSPSVHWCASLYIHTQPASKKKPTHDLWRYDNYHHTRARFQKALLLLLKIHVCAFCDSFISAIQAGSIYSKPDKGNEFI